MVVFKSFFRGHGPRKNTLKAKNGLALSAKPFFKTGGGTGGGQREEAGLARRNDSQSPVQQRVKEVDTLTEPESWFSGSVFVYAGGSEVGNLPLAAFTDEMGSVFFQVFCPAAADAGIGVSFDDKLLVRCREADFYRGSLQPAQHLPQFIGENETPAAIHKPNRPDLFHSNPPLL